MSGTKLICVSLLAAALIGCEDEADDTTEVATETGISTVEKERVVRECRADAREALGITAAEVRSAETVTDRPLTADESLYLAHSKPCMERGGLIVLDTDEGRIIATPRP